MKLLKFVAQVALLYAFSFVGDCLRSILHLPIPGSIIGLILLFMALIFKICPIQWIETGAGILLKYLPMVFIPATVGVMNYTHTFIGHGVVLLVIVAISTVVVMISAGYTSQFLANKVQNRREQKLWQSS